VADRGPVARDLKWGGEALHVAADEAAIQNLVAEIEAASAGQRESVLLKASAIFSVVGLGFGIAWQRCMRKRAAAAQSA
jgi:hypothetical protein